MLTTLLIANRGAIACRILRTLRAMNIRGVAVYSEADLSSLHIREADEALSLGEGPAANTYLVSEKIIAAARASGAQAIHPGYGFLSENAAFAEACEAAGIAFVGPTPEQLRLFGLKHTARALAKAHGVPMLEGTGLLANVDEAVHAAAVVGYPVILKAPRAAAGSACASVTTRKSCATPSMPWCAWARITLATRACLSKNTLSGRVTWKSSCLVTAKAR